MGKIGRVLPPKYNLTGQIFGMLEVKRMVRDKQNRYVCEVQCICGGHNKLVNHQSLLKGRTTSCGCRRDQYIKNTGKNSSTYTGYEEIRGTWWRKIKVGAERRGHEWNLSMKDAWELFEKQNRKCILTGIPIYFGRSGKNKEQTASIDRINNCKGYSIDNIQWVHKNINLMRNKLSIEEFQEMCKLVAKYADN